jgi:hypothetical protein
MAAVRVVVVQIGRDKTHEVFPAKDYGVVEQRATQTADPTLSSGILPWTPVGCPAWFAPNAFTNLTTAGQKIEPLSTMG